MNVKIHPSWYDVLKKEFSKPYFENLVHFVRTSYKNHKCYPKAKDVFAAFNYCHFDKLKVLILGQDPYHGSNQANGLCFSVNEGVSHPPSLINIFKEVSDDMKVTYPENGHLERWASQGILLLNATLTVQEGMAGSHQNKGWESFTDQVISTISEQKEKMVFILWGGYAKRKQKYIDADKHEILTSGHPSPLSANRGFWFGNRHFSRCNTFLEQYGMSPIDWS